MNAFMNGPQDLKIRVLYAKRSSIKLSIKMNRVKKRKWKYRINFKF